ncbi:endonuclease/exonuclease/phosphatase family protein [Thermasporomyces composti]|uniref:Endonuclease/exonuclease/phosphatase family metal-dependent hydrolase n=1 Tax=Thermasporomyces composti TaxID=696763 RepID=A0A3D9V4C5_THECX|nr:endonuclease/exonuclease/phosphatase family protein [Thermasporomyces composti]REF36588.1 endonuclease/exonuclease/phosphatase family metal-dependent hydrolase [Thermasporomyces composti]
MSDDMRRRTLLTAGLTLGAVPIVSGVFTRTAHAAEAPLIGPARGDDIHVMTYNIRYDRPDPSPDSWPERLPLIAEQLRRERPTILGTQEGLYHQARQIRDELPPFYDFIHLFRNGGSQGEGMVIYFDTNRLQPVAYDHLWLSDTPRLIGSATWGNTVIRMLTWVRFHDLKTGREFVHLNTHFDHQSENSRQRSAEMVRDVVAEFDVPVIVTGDFNSTAGVSASYQILTEGGLVDTWEGASERLTPEYNTFNSWNTTPVEGGDRIDWILVTPQVSVSKIGINTWSRDGHTPSDHWPVQALVRLR